MSIPAVLKTETDPNKYRKAFNRLYRRLTPEIKAKVDAAKANKGESNDKDVNLFVTQLCELAEDGIISTTE